MRLILLMATLLAPLAAHADIPLSLPTCAVGDARTPVQHWAPSIDGRTLDTAPGAADGQVFYIEFHTDNASASCAGATADHLYTFDHPDADGAGLAVNLRGNVQFANGMCYFAGYFMNEPVMGMHPGLDRNVLPPIGQSRGHHFRQILRCTRGARQTDTDQRDASEAAQDDVPRHCTGRLYQRGRRLRGLHPRAPGWPACSRAGVAIRIGIVPTCGNYRRVDRRNLQRLVRPPDLGVPRGQHGQPRATRVDATSLPLQRRALSGYGRADARSSLQFSAGDPTQACNSRSPSINFGSDPCLQPAIVLYGMCSSLDSDCIGTPARCRSASTRNQSMRLGSVSMRIICPTLRGWASSPKYPRRRRALLLRPPDRLSAAMHVLAPPDP